MSKFILYLALVSSLASAKSVLAGTIEFSDWALGLSASSGLGTLKNDDRKIVNRTMNALSLEALPAYRLGSWALGPHFDYRFQEQLSSLKEAGGTNWRGRGYLIGLGARKEISSRGFIQASFDFLGEYDLLKNTSANQNDHIFEPLGLRVRAGHSFFGHYPNLTFDIDVHYLKFKKIEVSGDKQSAESNQMIASLGVTCVLPCWSRAEPKIEPFAASSGEAQPPAVQAPLPSPRAQQQEELAQVIEVKKVENALQIILSGANFDSNSAVLKPEGREKLKRVAQTLIKYSTENLRIEGHTDASGNAEKNRILSMGRAESVKTFFIEQGLKGESMTTQGFGQTQPIAPNTTKEGRAINRRVEVFIDEKEGQ